MRDKTAGEAIEHCGTVVFEQEASTQPGAAMRNLMGNRNHGSILKKIAAAGLACLLFVAGLPLSVAAAESCKGWKTAKFFETSTVEQVRACLSAGRDPNEQDPKGLTALHRAARDTTDPAVIDALLEAGANPRVSSRAGRLPRYYARKNKKIQGSDAYQRLMVVSAKEPKNQGTLRLGHGRLHHARAQERTDTHLPEVGCTQGTHPTSVLEKMAGVDHPCSFCAGSGIVSSMGAGSTRELCCA